MEAGAVLDSADASAGARLQSVSEIALRSHLARGDVLYQQFQVAPALVQYRKADNLQRLLRPEDARLSAHLLLARSEEHTSELQSLMRISYAVFCLKKQKQQTHSTPITK